MNALQVFEYPSALDARINDRTQGGMEDMVASYGMTTGDVVMWTELDSEHFPGLTRGTIGVVVYIDSMSAYEKDWANPF